ncbi:MAG: hypothetical protein ACRC9X_07360 [Bacteroidales bacterium]
MKFVYLALFSLLLLSCEKKDYRRATEKEKSSSTFDALYGEYKLDEYYSWGGGVYEIRNNEYYRFDESNMCKYGSCNWSYTPQNGWVNATKQWYFADYKWEVRGSELYVKKYILYNDSFEDRWTVHKFKFISADSIKVGDFFYVRKNS